MHRERREKVIALHSFVLSLFANTILQLSHSHNASDYLLPKVINMHTHTHTDRVRDSETHIHTYTHTQAQHERNSTTYTDQNKTNNNTLTVMILYKTENETKHSQSIHTDNAVTWNEYRERVSEWETHREKKKQKKEKKKEEAEKNETQITKRCLTQKLSLSFRFSF